MNKYLRLPDGVVFQKRPDGATLYFRGGGTEWGERRRMGVNLDGARLLEYCNGRGTMETVIAAHNLAYPENIVTRETAALFFGNAEGAGMVEISDSAGEAKAEFCGSYECFFPSHTTVEVTSQCNYNCRHCYRDSSPENNSHIDHEKLMAYLRAFRDNGGLAMEITGGEPMLYGRFFELVEWACGNMDVVGILTNGYYLDEKAITRLLPFREKLVFNISLDSHRPEFHNKFRGKPDAFEKTIRALELLGANKFRFRLSMCVSRDNFFDMEGVAELAKKYGAVYFGCNPVQDSGRAGALIEEMAQEYAKDPKRYVEYEQMIHEKYKGFLHVLSEKSLKKLATGNCGIVHQTVTIGPDGTLRPCVMFDGGLELGNIHKQTFKEIFHSPLGKAFSQMRAPGKEICGDCEKVGLCKGCILRGIKNGLEHPDCKWLKSGDALKYISRPPETKECRNLTEPCHG